MIFDNQHLLGQHRECHSMITSQVKRCLGIKGGYQHHPNCMRFDDDPGQLIDLHDKCVKEMLRRGFKHNSPILFGLHFDYKNPRLHQYAEVLPQLCFSKSRFNYTLDEEIQDLDFLIERLK